VAWLLGALFGLQSLLYYGVVTWLAAIYVDRGWTEPASASLVALFGAVTLVATTVMPLGADRIGSRRSQLVAAALLIVVGLVGVAVVPDPAVAWAVILGAGMGAIFPIVLTLPVDVGGRPVDVAATAAMMLLVGYILSAVGPLAFGIARDVTGGFALGMALLITLGIALVVLCAALTPERLHRTGSARAGSF
jgi:CP family cyanate transporter-like MFS transporter